jgi:hypothetical protein
MRLLLIAASLCYAHLLSSQSAPDSAFKNIRWFVQTGASISVIKDYDAMSYSTRQVRPYGGAQLKTDVVYYYEGLPVYISGGILWINTNYQFYEISSPEQWKLAQNHVLGMHLGGGVKLRLSSVSSLDFRAESIVFGFRHDATKWQPVHLNMGLLSAYCEYSKWKRIAGFGIGFFFGPVGQMTEKSWSILTLPGNGGVPVDQLTRAISLDFRLGIFEKWRTEI